MRTAELNLLQIKAVLYAAPAASRLAKHPAMRYPVERHGVSQDQRRFLLCRPTLWLALMLSLWAAAASLATAQGDTTTSQRRVPINHSPNGALWRAAAVPGWGQMYNRQYLKIPLVYVGLAGFTAAALYTNNRYLLYRHAFLFTAREDEDGNPVFPQYASDYAQLLNELGLPSESTLTEEEIESRRTRLEPQFRAQRDNLRRNRDLLYFGIVFWYGLSILDAFVSAHLLDFDVGEDLTLSVSPNLLRPGLTATVRWRP